MKKIDDSWFLCFQDTVDSMGITHSHERLSVVPLVHEHNYGCYVTIDGEDDWICAECQQAAPRHVVDVVLLAR